MIICTMQCIVNTLIILIAITYALAFAISIPDDLRNLLCRPCIKQIILQAWIGHRATPRLLFNYTRPFSTPLYDWVSHHPTSFPLI